MGVMAATVTVLAVDAVDEILKGVERGDGNAQPEGGR